MQVWAQLNSGMHFQSHKRLLATPSKGATASQSNTLADKSPEQFCAE